jgi:hypothetical protein
MRKRQEMKTSAIFSTDRLYRYALYRVWDESLPLVLFVGLNPSTADEKVNDPTIIRCMNYAKAWNYGGVIMANLFAFRSTDPKNLKNQLDPIGFENDLWIQKLASEAQLVIAAWGTHGTLLNRNQEVKKMFKNLLCLELSKDGHPKHPLYLKKDLTPKKFK